jgi:hypothetical protein
MAVPVIGGVGEGLFELGIEEDPASVALRRGVGGDVANTLVMVAKFGLSARLCARSEMMRSAAS